MSRSSRIASHRVSIAATHIESFESRVLLSTTLPVMGYLVDYKISDAANPIFGESYGATTTTIAHDTLDWAHLAEVNYFALLPNASPTFSPPPTGASLTAVTSDGGLQAHTDSGYDPARQLPALVAEAHAKNPNTKVYVTVGAGDPNAIYCMDGLVNTPAAWGPFATAIHNFVTQYGLDGVDFDWEPTAQAGFTVTATQITNFGKLIKTIKAAYPEMGLTADSLGFPQELSSAAGVDTHTTAYMLDSVAVQNLDAINVEAYPVGSKAESDAIMQQWAIYFTTGNDLNGLPVNGPVRRLQYGLDTAGDDVSNNPAGVIEGKADLTIDQGYGGMFIFELNSDAGTGTASVVSRIATEVATHTAGNTDVVTGTSGNDAITLTRDIDGKHIDWTVTGGGSSSSGKSLIVDPNGLTLNGVGGNDTITLSAAHGSPLPALVKLNGGFTLNGLTSLAGATIDLGASTLFINYAGGVDPIATVRQYLSAGSNGGLWTGVNASGAINSSAAAVDPTRATAIGFADAADGRGINTTANTVKVRFTFKGDASLDGSVDFADLLILAKAYNATSTTWDQGDFDGDGNVTFADLLILAKNYGKRALVPATLPATVSAYRRTR